MIWLFLLIVFLQAGFYWLFNPTILLTTQFFEAHGLGLIVLLFLLWLVSGKQNFKDI